MVDTPTQVPRELIAGDTFEWERDLSDYPADTWTLTYYFDSPEDTFSVVATADGTTHVASVAGATTAGYTVGEYRWHARATDGSTIKTVESGWLSIKPDPASDVNTDWRSHARKMRDAIRATLEGQATKGQLDLVSYSIGGTVNLSRDREHLRKLLKEYEAQVLAEGDSAGTSKSRHIYLRFGSP